MKVFSMVFQPIDTHKIKPSISHTFPDLVSRFFCSRVHNNCANGIHHTFLTAGTGHNGGPLSWNTHITRIFPYMGISIWSYPDKTTGGLGIYCVCYVKFGLLFNCPFYFVIQQSVRMVCLENELLHEQTKL